MVSPGVFEVDLVFPRNATYTPQALSPLIWAVQNPNMALPMAVSINWDLLENNNRSAPGSILGGLFELNDPYTSNEPVLLSRFINTMAYPEGQWTLSWSVEFSNCSQQQDRNLGTVIEQASTTTFTISKSGDEPDLVAATSSDQCGTAPRVALNVTGFGNYCGRFGPTPTSNPCGVTINSTTNSSLLAAATASACAPLQSENANLTCPTGVPSSASNFVDQSRMAVAPILLMLLSMITFLGYLG